ncbi:MAG: SDR family oxidoreductase [Planctomycetia bacterium]|nr:SDR family oxidoreductase [Planctomycetia bacterium]
MKYLALTGATGLLGSYLLKELLQRDIPVLALVRASRRESPRQRMEGILRRFENRLGRPLPRPVVMEMDLHKPFSGLEESQRQWIRQHVDTVLHNAASLVFRRDEQNEPYRSNVEGTRHVLDWCREAGIRRFFYVSTAYVCGLREGKIAETELDEGQTWGNDYEKSKVEAEKLVRQASFEEGLTVFRPAIIVGDRWDGYTPTFHGFYTPLKILLPFLEPGKIDLLQGRMLASLLGFNPEDGKNFVPVDWVAKVMVQVLQNRAWHGKTYHLTAAERVSIAEMCQVFYEGIQRFSRPSTQTGKTLRTDWETLWRIFVQQMDVYRTYWRNDPEFDMTHTLSIARTFPPPRMTREILLRLVRYAIRSGCGWPLPPPVSMEREMETFWKKNAEVEWKGWERGEEESPEPFSFGLRISGKGGGDWTFSTRRCGKIFVRWGLPVEDSPLLTMNSALFHRLKTLPRDYLFWNTSWERDCEHRKNQALAVLRNIVEEK